MTLLTARAARAQRMVATVAEAEAEGAAFARALAPAIVPAAYRAGAFDGSIERRCVRPTSYTAWPASLRSGEIIIRGYTGLTAEASGNKMLWMPLHDPGQRAVSLVIRGVRLGHPADTIRQTRAEARVVRHVRDHGSFGFPSVVRFPAAGQWLVVAETDRDWGCFVLNVADAER